MSLQRGSAARLSEVFEFSLRLLARIKRGDLWRAVLRRWRNVTKKPDPGYAWVGSTFKRTSAWVLTSGDYHTVFLQDLAKLLTTLDSLPTRTRALMPRKQLQLSVVTSATEDVMANLRSLPRHWSIEQRGQIIDVSSNYALPVKRFAQLPALDARICLVTPSDVKDEHRNRFRPARSLDESHAYRSTPRWPIDVVYSWVDGDDPSWQQRRNAALLEACGNPQFTPSLHQNSVDEARYTNSDELLYSLRSVYQFANWVRRIFIVTDRQVPGWLRTDDPRITIVDHRQILPRSTFNSHAIESALHRIPGLSEHYLYLNDDVFFGRPAYPSDYFDESGRAKFFPSRLEIPNGEAAADDKPIIAAAKNGRSLIREHFGVEITNRLSHSVHAQRRSVVEKMERALPEEFERLAHSLFRSPRDLSIAASLHHWYGRELDLATPAETNYFYLNITERGSRQALEALSSLRRYDVFCLNQEESHSRSHTARADLTQFLRSYFPLPSPWEKYHQLQKPSSTDESR